LEKYITGIIQNYKHKLLAIGAMPDHIHILIGYNVNQLIPDLVEKVKTSSNAWIKQKRLSTFKFEWQKGYGAFSHSSSQINQVVKYIINQEKHHCKKTFREEYIEFLRKNKIQFQMVLQIFRCSAPDGICCPEISTTPTNIPVLRSCLPIFSPDDCYLILNNYFCITC
jgi:REP element-mobilizing transposase RayT